MSKPLTKPFTIGMIAELIDAPRPRLAKWVQLGLPVFDRDVGESKGDVPSAGPGKGAKFSFHSLMRLCLADRLVFLGMLPKDALTAAVSFAYGGAPGRAPARPYTEGFSLFTYPECLPEQGMIGHFTGENLQAAEKSMLDWHGSLFLRHDPPRRSVNLNLMYETIAGRLGRDPEDYRKIKWDNTDA
jgi:hypothetical protein